ncbi:aspartic peptidase domain-containing protein [Boletus edulis]|nr:aspartic peptidase domain-containing protein [Boletus edulis]
MTGSRVGRVLVLVSLVISCQGDGTETRLTSAGIHVPIVRRQSSRHVRRSVDVGSIGLGDFEDITYNVQIQVGETHIPVVLDTGSSDLWVLSTSCQDSCSSNSTPLYPATSFRPANLDSTLTYGDSKTGTYARGPIGSDFVSLAGLGLQGQYFSAINSTNTSVAQTGSAGIFGLGFPFNSLLWTNLALIQNGSANTVVHRANDAPREVIDVHARFPDRFKNLVTRWFLKNDLGDDTGTPPVRSTRQLTAATLQSSIVNYGPLIPRLVAQGMLDSPMFSITLQRDTIQIGGNEGMLSIGQLPPSVKSESLTWVSVRGYPPSQGGLQPPSDTPGEVYAVAWEIPLEDVWFDGVKLARSTLSSPNISLSALIDTGNSLIRGPPDVVAQIHAILGGQRFACSPPHTLEFQIGGRLFPVDPRDFISEARPGDPDLCSANVVPTDVPVSGGTGYLYSWNLGDPFLKGVLAAFHYGSLTHPSQNPPRVGLLSTVDLNAGKQLCDDKHKAEVRHEGYPSASWVFDRILARVSTWGVSSARGAGASVTPTFPGNWNWRCTACATTDRDGERYSGDIYKWWIG